MSKIRLERINSEIVRNLSEILRAGLRDRELTAMTSVTYCRVSADLEHATIGLSVYGTPEQKQTNFDAVCASKGYLKRELAARMKHMRILPDLHFEPDNSLDYSAHINEILDRLKKEE